MIKELTFEGVTLGVIVFVAGVMAVYVVSRTIFTAYYNSKKDYNKENENGKN